MLEIMDIEKQFVYDASMCELAVYKYHFCEKMIILSRITKRKIRII